MIVDAFYLSEESNIKKLSELTDLDQSEIKSIVGEFKERHRFAGKLKGEVVIYSNNTVVIRHHFTKKRLWKGELVLSFNDSLESF